MEGTKSNLRYANANVTTTFRMMVRFVMIVLLGTKTLNTVSSFSQGYAQIRRQSLSSSSRRAFVTKNAKKTYCARTTSLFMGNNEEEEVDNNENKFGGLFKNMFENKDSQQETVGPKVLVDLKCSDIKVGGLRLAVALHCMGLQNTPSPGSWRANQSNDGIIDLFFMDGTASLAINFDEDFGGRIWIERWGSGTSQQPSLQYMLQESLILHNLLDEIETLAFENTEEVEDGQRLLVLQDGRQAIEQIRSTLPARKA